MNLSRQKIAIICVVLGLVVLAQTLDSMANPSITATTDLTILGALVAKDMNPALFTRDNLFSNEELYRFYTPVYRWIAAQVWQYAGSFELGLIWLVPPVLIIYLIGMFILLYKITGNYWVSLGTSLASSLLYPTIGATVWGIGGSANMMARTLFMPAIPFITIIFLTILREPKWSTGIILGLMLGLAANLHPVSGLHLSILFLTLLILVHGNSLKGWQILIAAGVATAIGAYPMALNFLSSAGRPVSGDDTFAAYSKIVIERFRMDSLGLIEWPQFGLELKLTAPIVDVLVWLYLVAVILFVGGYLWSRLYQPALGRWCWIVGGLTALAYAYVMALMNATFIFSIVAVYLVYRFWRNDYAKLDKWLISLMGLIVLYAFVGRYVVVSIWQTFDVWALTPLVTDHSRAARFLYLPIFLLVGLAATALAHELSVNRWASKLGGVDEFSLVIVLVIGLAPSIGVRFADNLFLAVITVSLFILVSGTLVLSLAKGVRYPWRLYLSITIFVLILFGPPALFLKDYLPVPVRNLFQPNNLTVKPVSNDVDAGLYDWVLQNTSSSALFYGCFGPVTMTSFRHNTQRNITHNWKDLNFVTYHRATLIPAYRRFRRLEAACKSFEEVVAAAHALEADYILIASTSVADYLHAACFVNEKYAAFPVGSNQCVLN